VIMNVKWEILDGLWGVSNDEIKREVSWYMSLLGDVILINE
jgi:hypothetical protein